MKKEHYKIIFYFVYNIKKYKDLSEEQKQEEIIKNNIWKI